MMMQRYGAGLLACLVLCALALSGCGGGDDHDGGDQVTIRGIVDDGTPTSPIPGAACQLLNQNNVSLMAAAANASGAYVLLAPTDMVGSIVCAHPAFPNLKLIALISTVGQPGGGVMVEDLTPASSMAHHIIMHTDPSDPQAAKEQLQSEIAAASPAMSLLAEAATIMFNAMLDASLDIDFQQALEDMMADGQMSLADMQPLMPGIEQAIAAAEQQHGMTLIAAIVEKLGVNAPPVAADDAAATDEDTPVAIDVLQNDTDPNVAMSLSIAPAFPVAAPGHGMVSIDGATVIYTPDANFFGADVFSYRVCDDGAPPLCSAEPATVSVMVNPVNDPPIAQDDDRIGTPVNTPVAIPVLANDADVDGDSLSIVAVTQGDMGGMVTHDNTQIMYTPGAGFEGTETLTYTVGDGQAADTAAVTVIVTNDQHAPVAQDDAAFTHEDQAVVIDVLQNDADPDGNALSIDSSIFPVSAPSHGVVAINGASVLYTPNANFAGEDVFSYRVCDNGAPVLCSVSPATVTVTINPVADAPLAQDDTVSTDEDQAVTIHVLQNDTDPDNGVLSIDSSTFPVSPPSHGAVAINGASIVYTPDANFFGADAFSYRVCNNSAPVLCSANAATVSITVNSINDLPVIIQAPPTQMSIVGRSVTPLDLPANMVVQDVEDGDCASCVFSVANTPPHLTLAGNVVSGNIAFNAFSLGDNGMPNYNVTVRVEDSDGGVSTALFTWRVAQEQIDEIAGEDDGGDGGDGDADGDGDGGAEGDAGDGGDASPMAGAMCRLVDLDGVAVRDNDGMAIMRQVDAMGRFLLPIPEANPDDPDPQAPLRAIEGFIECYPPGKPDLGVSLYINTTGMRRNERLRNLSVDPATTVTRQLCDSLQTVGAQADMVGLQARFLHETQGLATKSPQAMSEVVFNAGCGSMDTLTLTDELNIPLQNDQLGGGPPIPANPRASIAAYVSSQLFLAAFKVQDGLQAAGLLQNVADGDCAVDPPTAGAGPNQFLAALHTYYQNDQISPENLVNLGMGGDQAIAVSQAVC